jgi:hypothetical protein
MQAWLAATPAERHHTSNVCLLCCVVVRRLQELCDAGPTPPPGDCGAKFIIRKDGRRINLGFLRDGASKQLEVRHACHVNAVMLACCLCQKSIGGMLPE